MESADLIGRTESKQQPDCAHLLVDGSRWRSAGPGTGVQRPPGATWSGEFDGLCSRCTPTPASKPAGTPWNPWRLGFVEGPADRRFGAMESAEEEEEVVSTRGSAARGLDGVDRNWPAPEAAARGIGIAGMERGTSEEDAMPENFARLGWAKVSSFLSRRLPDIHFGTRVHLHPVCFSIFQILKMLRKNLQKNCACT